VLLIAGAIVLGIGVGLALGGSLRELAEASFRWWWLALVGLALQFIPVPAGHRWVPVALLLASYAVLLLFVAANLRYIGFWLVAAGFALNILVIALNGGMPVNDHALREAYGSSYQGTRNELLAGGGAKHHLARSGDVLLPLSDVIPVGTPVHNVFSIGDIVAMFGVGWALAEATKGPPGKHRVRAGWLVSVRSGSLGGDSGAPLRRSAPPGV
jgi:hypothetical protein